MKLCQICGHAQATIHATHVVNGKKSERVLCQSCYDKEGLADPFSAIELVSLLGDDSIGKSAKELGLELFAKLLREAANPSLTKKCESCGTTGKDLQKKGLVGCPEDYGLFRDELLPIIERLHGSRRHVGKSPLPWADKVARTRQRQGLEKELAEAVKHERYEEAARLRDQIKMIKPKQDAP